MGQKPQLRYIYGRRLSRKRREWVLQLMSAVPEAHKVQPLMGDARKPQDDLPVYAFCLAGDRPVGYCELYLRDEPEQDEPMQDVSVQDEPVQELTGPAVSVQELPELRGMVAEDYRRQGCFRTMVNELMRGRGESCTFVGAGDAEAFCRTMDAMGATLVGRELLMAAQVSELTLPEESPEGLSVEIEHFREDDETAGDSEEDREGETETIGAFAYLGDECVGQMFVQPGATCFLFGVEVREEMRRRGIALAMLGRVLRTMPPSQRVALHVTEANAAAVRLYEKLGMRVAEELRQYLLRR